MPKPISPRFKAILSGLKTPHGWAMACIVCVAFALLMEIAWNQPVLQIQWLLLSLAVLTGWCLLRRFYAWGLISLVFGGLLFIQTHVQQSALLQEYEAYQGLIRVDGHVVKVLPETSSLKLLLDTGRVQTELGEFEMIGLNLIVPAKQASKKPFRYYGQDIIVRGKLKQVQMGANGLTEWRLHRSRITITLPAERWQPTAMNRWLPHLAARARFYLSDQPFQLYQTMLLGIKRGSYEVKQLFVQNGLAHVLAISGLHIAMIYGLILAALSFIRKRLALQRGFLALLLLSDVVGLLLVWIYILMLGFPAPATRAGVMITLWRVSRWKTTAHPTWQILLMTALGFLMHNPMVMFDLSFQLSFAAVAAILLALPLLPRLNQHDSIPMMMGKWVAVTLIISLVITLALSPILLHIFARLPLQSIALNVVVILVLQWVLLPLGVLCLIISILYYGQEPFALVEWHAFELLDWVYAQTISMLQRVTPYLEWAVVEVELSWPVVCWVVYYFMWVMGLKWLGLLRKQRVIPQSGTI